MNTILTYVYNIALNPSIPALLVYLLFFVLLEGEQQVSIFLKPLTVFLFPILRCIYLHPCSSNLWPALLYIKNITKASCYHHRASCNCVFQGDMHYQFKWLARIKKVCKCAILFIIGQICWLCPVSSCLQTQLTYRDFFLCVLSGTVDLLIDAWVPRTSVPNLLSQLEPYGCYYNDPTWTEEK